MGQHGLSPLVFRSLLVASHDPPDLRAFEQEKQTQKCLHGIRTTDFVPDRQIVHRLCGWISVHFSLNSLAILAVAVARFSKTLYSASELENEKSSL
jgi:hypothetical protein